ncbi:DsbA family oxidoreductase [Microbacterium sp. MAHUQ-60]|uniref:DsbA family oxidoreductase n=1 Tax=unclassified Microbacterium TaxID=2609290 RepID=UPI0036176BD7
MNNIMTTTESGDTRGSAGRELHDRTHHLKVDVWADVMCPWCYLGKRRLDAAAASFAARGLGEGRKVEIEFHSFQLAPDLPAGKTEPAAAFIARETGSTEAEVHTMLNHMVRLGKRIGIDYNWDAVQVTNTLLAHQLIHHAKAAGKQLEAEEALFAAYFTEGRDVGDAEVLADIAERLGLDRAETTRALASSEHLPAVRSDIARAGAQGITGVPFFVVDGKYALSGAQEQAVLERALEQAWSERPGA